MNKRGEKQLSRILIVLAITAGICMPTANALSVSSFSDVAPTSPWTDGISYVVEHGIANGTSAPTFFPEEETSLGQMCVMLCRTLVPGDTSWSPDNAVNYAHSMGWIKTDGDPAAEVNNKITRQYAYTTLGQLATTHMDPIDDPLALLTRGELAQIFYALQLHQLAQEHLHLLKHINLQTSADCSNPVMIRDVLHQAAKVPSAILDRFHADGWTLYIDQAGVDNYSTIHGNDFTGITSFKNTSIYIKLPKSVVHEFGHYLHYAIKFPEQVNTLFQEECSTAATVLGTYSKQDQLEYFAEFFEFWILKGEDISAMEKLKASAPKTYKYFADLEANAWNI